VQDKGDDYTSKSAQIRRKIPFLGIDRKERKMKKEEKD